MLFPHMCPNSAFFLTPSSWTVSRFLIYWIIHFPQGIWKEQLSSSRLGCRHLNRSMSHHTALQGWHTSSFAYRTVRAGNCSLWNSCHCLNLFTDILSLMVKAEVVKSNSCTLPCRPTDMPFFTIKYFIGDTTETKSLSTALNTHQKWGSGCIWQIDGLSSS